MRERSARGELRYGRAWALRQAAKEAAEEGDFKPLVAQKASCFPSFLSLLFPFPSFLPFPHTHTYTHTHTHTHFRPFG